THCACDHLCVVETWPNLGCSNYSVQCRYHPGNTEQDDHADRLLLGRRESVLQTGGVEGVRNAESGGGRWCRIHGLTQTTLVQ
ncbi:hypothetical protein JG688_00002893, partial [Phytophthora aleatoria]